MKRTKKLLFVLMALFAFSAASYAVEVSLGFSAGGGVPIFRGKDDFSKTIDDIVLSIDSDGNTEKVKATIDTSVDVMIGFLPYLALETGVGYKLSMYSHSGGTTGIFTASTITALITRSEIYIPVMLRVQYEYSIGVTYLSAGVKVGFGEDDYFVLTAIGGGLGGAFGTQGTVKQSPVSLDVAFSLGQEFKVKQSHFIGLRFNYDLNVVAPYAVSDRDNPKDGTFFNDVDFAHDDFTIQFTYRYVFGRS